VTVVKSGVLVLDEDRLLRRPQPRREQSGAQGDHTER
jgi:hypothetical protein